LSQVCRIIASDRLTAGGLVLDEADFSSAGRQVSKSAKSDIEVSIQRKGQSALYWLPQAMRLHW
jgi:hypothetical protein